MEFSEFYAANRDRCLSVVTVVVADRLLAEELVAESFARAFVRWTKLQDHPDPRAWVVRTALNANVSRWRRHRRQLPAMSFPATAAGPTEPMNSAIVTAVASLPLRQRQVIALRIFLDLDTATTSRVLDIAEGTVTAHLHRATTTLKNLLRPSYELEITT